MLRGTLLPGSEVVLLPDEEASLLAEGAEDGLEERLNAAGRKLARVSCEAGTAGGHLRLHLRGRLPRNSPAQADTAAGVLQHHEVESRGVQMRRLAVRREMSFTGLVYAAFLHEQRMRPGVRRMCAHAAARWL